MNKTFKTLLLTLGCSSLVLFAANPWKDKKAADWNIEDATRVLTNSPWARTVSARMDFSRMGGRPEGGMGGPGGMSGPGGMDPPKVLVRWESAVPVREASVKIEDGQGSRLGELAKEYYVISTSVTGTMGAGRGRQEEQGRSDPDFSRMQETMLEVTTLKVKGKDPLAPAKIEVIPSAGGITTLVLFPRTRAISPDDKEVTFKTSMGPMVIESKFTLKNMVYDGQLAL